MKLHRDVIIDLLPVYLAGEASTETQRLVEASVAGDPEVAQLVERARAELVSLAPPTVTRKENQTMELEKVRRLALIRTLGLSFLFSIVFIATVTLAIGAVMIFAR